VGYTFAMTRVVTIVGLFVVAGFAGLHAGGPAAGMGGSFMLHLEVAGSAARMAQLIEQAGLSLGDVRAALAWDYLFLASYGPLIAIAAAFAGRFLGRRWELPGALAALMALTGAALDAVENAALLHALEGHAGAKVALVAAVAKFALILPAAAFALVASVGAVFAWRRAKPPAAFPTPGPVTGPAPALTCDVVMKGGITSGVVYPRAVGRLAQTYRFVNVGGASAGAIAASATAAAEYARANGRDGFAAVEALPAWLGGDGRLFNLFRPQPATRAPFEVFAAFLGNVPFPLKVARAFAATIWHLPLAFLAGLVPGGLVAWGAFGTDTPAFGVSGAVGMTLVLAPIVVVLGLLVTVVVRLPRNGFGMCSGRLRGKEILSDWLSATLDNIAGIRSAAGQDRRPLLFADLWTAGEDHATVEAVCAAAAGRAPGDRRINFEALTTSLSHGRPYRLPQLLHTFYFRPADLVEVVPEYVVNWMVSRAGSPLRVGGDVYHRLPAPHELPVVFAARLSLSFPFLISAVKLWGVDYERPKNAALGAGDTPQLDVCWMSDGGIASNFPIHFFDAFVPGRPTFGLDLQPFHVDRRRDETNEANNVFLPDNNTDGSRESWNHFSGMGGFVGALVDAIQAFLDNMQARAPSFRDRIARIYLAPDEGGLNLAMPTAVLDRLGKRGEAAGLRIVERFVEERPSGWDNHRWVRLRLLLGRLDPLLRQFAKQLADTPPPTPPPSYPWKAHQHRAAARAINVLCALGRALERTDVTLDEGAPRPVPELRITPRV
jgi:hypothetical protein